MTVDDRPLETGLSADDGARRSRVTFHLAALLAALACVVLWLLSLRTYVDDDLWLHLRIGNELRSGNWFRTGPDPLTATADLSYMPTQWLAEIVGSWVYDVMGLQGIRLLRGFGVTAVALFIYLVARTVSTPIRSAIVTLPATFATSAAWGERPQLAGLVMLAVVLWLWLRARSRGTDPWIAVPVTWLWAGIHGTWAIGIAVGAVIVLSMARDSKVGRSRLLRHLTIVTVSAGTVALTPLGPSLLLQPFAVSDSARDSVNEWQSPALDNPTFVVALSMAVVAGYLLFRSRTTLVMAWSLLVLGLALACFSVRTVAFGAVILSAVLAISLRGRAPAYSAIPRHREAVLWLSAALVVLLSGLTFQTSIPRVADPAILGHLSTIQPGSNIIVQPRVSGWVLFHYPDLRPLRDLRAEAYSGEASQLWGRIWAVQSGWREELAALKVSHALIEAGEPLALALASSGWQRVGEGDGYELWRDSPALGS